MSDLTENSQSQPNQLPVKDLPKKRGPGRPKGTGKGKGGNAKRIGKHRAGRPSTYKKEYATLVYDAILLGKTIPEISDLFKISIAGFYNWQKKHPDFKKKVEEAANADASVARSLYNRALGYNYKAVHIAADAKTGAIVQVPYIEHCPPDVGAQKHILATRHPKLWREKTSVELTGPDGAPPTIAIRITAEELPKAKEAKVIDVTPVEKKEQPKAKTSRVS